jgi:ketosteroid isomerase-like protein
MTIDQSTILNIIERRVAGVKAKDVTMATSDYSTHVVLFDIVDPLERHGLDAVKARLQEWLGSLQEIRSFEIRNVDIRVSETIAYCTSMNHIEAINTKGSRLDMWWRETTCYQKESGEWKISHAHSSVPFNTDSGQPSLGLRPEQIR